MKKSKEELSKALDKVNASIDALQEEKKRITQLREHYVVGHNLFLLNSGGNPNSSLLQYKVVRFLISRIKPQSKKIKYSFSVSEFCKVIGNPKSGNNYQHIRHALSEGSKLIWYRYVDDQGNLVEEAFSPYQAARIVRSNGSDMDEATIDVDFNIEFTEACKNFFLTSARGILPSIS